MGCNCIYETSWNNHQLRRQVPILPVASILSIAKTPYNSACDNCFSFCDSCHALRAPDLVMMQQLFRRHAWPGLFRCAMSNKTTPSDDNWRDITACHSTNEQQNTRDYLFTLTWFIRTKGVTQSLTCPRRSLVPSHEIRIIFYKSTSTK
jgi:hypothetical protein